MLSLFAFCTNTIPLGFLLEGSAILVNINVVGEDILLNFLLPPKYRNGMRTSEALKWHVNKGVLTAKWSTKIWLLISNVVLIFRGKKSLDLVGYYFLRRWEKLRYLKKNVCYSFLNTFFLPWFFLWFGVYQTPLKALWILKWWKVSSRTGCNQAAKIKASSVRSGLY